MTKSNELISMAESLPIDVKTQLIDRLHKSITHFSTIFPRLEWN